MYLSKKEKWYSNKYLWIVVGVILIIILLIYIFKDDIKPSVNDFIIERNKELEKQIQEKDKLIKEYELRIIILENEISKISTINESKRIKELEELIRSMKGKRKVDRFKSNEELENFFNEIFSKYK